MRILHVRGRFSERFVCFACDCFACGGGGFGNPAGGDLQSFSDGFENLDGDFENFGNDFESRDNEFLPFVLAQSRYALRCMQGPLQSCRFQAERLFQDEGFRQAHGIFFL